MLSVVNKVSKIRIEDWFWDLVMRELLVILKEFVFVE